MSNSLPTGFKFSGTACGIKASGKSDLAIIATDEDAVAAGVYTTNLIHAASIDWNRNVTPTARFRGLVVNSGNANACTGELGEQNNRHLAELVAKELGCQPQQVGVLSTGVIGHQLPMEKITSGISKAAASLAAGDDDFDQAAEAILTTDHGPKKLTRVIEVNGKQVRLAGIAKGAGMIGPRMATMLAAVTTDAQLDATTAQQLIAAAADSSFNCISVEGHMSTSDALLLIASGKSDADMDSDGAIEQFSAALNQLCLDLAKQIPADGEGASHVIEIKVSGTVFDADADVIARGVAASNLVKTAVTGNDPNWGRIVSAAGYCGVSFDANAVGLKLNGHTVFDAGQPVEFSDTDVSRSIADSFETQIELTVGSGPGQASHWTSDLTTAYVAFNSEYTT